MTVQEKMDLYLSKRDWLKTKAGRWALRKAMDDVKDTVTFSIDDAATITVNGRVFYSVGKAAGLALRDTFRYAGRWYVPADRTRSLGSDGHGRQHCTAARDLSRARLLATI